MQEVWKPVVGYEGLYEVSNLGRVKSLPRNGTINQVRLLKQSENGVGYLRVDLSKGNKSKTHNIHFLVACAFIGVPEKGIVIDHINNNRTDNRLSNLQLITHRENICKDRNSKSNIRGVYAVRNKYRAIIMINGKRNHLGYFNTIEEATKAYNQKLNEI